MNNEFNNCFYPCYNIPYTVMGTPELGNVAMSYPMNQCVIYSCDPNIYPDELMIQPSQQIVMQQTMQQPVPRQRVQIQQVPMQPCDSASSSRLLTTSTNSTSVQQSLQTNTASNPSMNTAPQAVNGPPSMTNLPNVLYLPDFNKMPAPTAPKREEIKPAVEKPNWRKYKDKTAEFDALQLCYLINFVRTLGYNVKVASKLPPITKLRCPTVCLIKKGDTTFYNITEDSERYMNEQKKEYRYYIFKRHNAKKTNETMIKILTDLGYSFQMKSNIKKDKGCECFDRFFRITGNGVSIGMEQAQALGKEIYMAFQQNTDAVVPLDTQTSPNH